MFLLMELSDIDVNDLIAQEKVVVGLDIGDKTVGIAVSDRRIKIASPLLTIARKNTDRHYVSVVEALKQYDIGLIIFGWPVQMNGIPGAQCEKNLKFAEKLSEYVPPDVNFSRWDERFSTGVVNNIMIKADLSRKKRKQSIDKVAAVYILQGAIDFLNRPYK
jgi:putative Holliday junction resolvase